MDATTKLKFKKLVPHAITPFMATSGSAGFDLTATHAEQLLPGVTAIVGTGISMEIPAGYVGMICPRSGLAAKHAITVANAPGIIDSDYRGEIKVLLANHATNVQFVSAGERIAQMVIVPVASIEFIEVEDVDETERGAGGFGSTGR